MSAGNNVKTTDLHQRLMSWYRQELDRQAANREQAMIDADFFDGYQWSEQDAAELEERGQAPTVFNMIGPAVSWVLGSQRRSTPDARVLPRREEDTKAAEIKSQILKYLSDVNRQTFAISRAFEDAAICGVGWIETGVQDEQDDGEPIYTRYEDWRSMLWDSASKELDLSDARYVFRTKVLDIDVANALFPRKLEQISAAKIDRLGVGGATGSITDDAMESMDLGDYGYAVRTTDPLHERERVRLIECWYVTPVKESVMSGGDFHGEQYNRDDVEQRIALMAGMSTVVNRTRMRVHVAIMTEKDMLYHGESPYRHNRFPFIAVWGNRRRRTRLPYGMVRTLRSIQEDLNKRASKSLFILSSNKVVVGAGEVDDWEDFEDAVSKPNGILKVKDVNNLKINVDRDLAAGHLEMMGRDAQMIQTSSGVTDELLGRTTNAVSGAAVKARQEQGSLTTSHYFNHLRLALQQHGELVLALCEQFMSEPKVVRIVGGTSNRTGMQWLKVNDPLLPESQITATKADFIIDEIDWMATWRQSMSEQLLQLVQKLPQEMAGMMMDMVVQMMDVPNKDEILKRIRQVNGMKDPDADPNEPPSPEEQAKIAAQQQQQQIAQADMELALAERQAKIAEMNARAAKSRQEAIAVALDNQQMSIQGSVVASSAPAVAPMADALLQSAGQEVDTA